MGDSRQNHQTDRLLRERGRPPPSSTERSAQTLFYEVKKAMLTATSPDTLSWDTISPNIGSAIIDSLAEDPQVEAVGRKVEYDASTENLTIFVMPTTLIHDAHQSWMGFELSRMHKAGFLTDDERFAIRTTASTTMTEFAGKYQGSRKEPDFQLMPKGTSMPSVVFESGWSESWAKLEASKNMWLVGGGQFVQLVFFIKWTKLTHNRVKGDVRVYGKAAAGGTVLLDSEQIFPAHDSPVITVTRGQLFGAAGVMGGRNPGDSFDLSLANLRDVADEWIRGKGLTPA